MIMDNNNTANNNHPSSKHEEIAREGSPALSNQPYYLAHPTAPPYHQPECRVPAPHLPHPIVTTAGHQPHHFSGTGMKHCNIPAVHFSTGPSFEAVDLESGPNSPPPHATRPMMGARDTNVGSGTDQEDGGSMALSKRRRRNRRYIISAVVVTIAVMLTAIITWVIVMHFGPPVRQPVPSESVHTNCVSCTILERAIADSNGRVPVNVNELDIRTADDGKFMCCIKVSDKTDAILEMLLDHARQTASIEPAMPPQAQNATRPQPTTVKEASAQIARRNQAAALVGLERNLPNVKDDDIYTLKEWGAQSSSVMYIRPLLKFSEVNGHFTVPFDGLYNINIHLSLTNRDTTKPLMSFGQRLMRFNRHFPQMGNEVLAFDEENVPVREQRTSSLTMTLHLRKDDELFIQVSPAGLIVENSARSFFCIVFESA